MRKYKEWNGNVGNRAYSHSLPSHNPSPKVHPRSPGQSCGHGAPLAAISTDGGVRQDQVYRRQRYVIKYFSLYSVCIQCEGFANLTKFIDGKETTNNALYIYHFLFLQPMPNRLARWAVNNVPAWPWLWRAPLFVMWFVELPLQLLIFTPWRWVAAAGTAALQVRVDVSQFVE